jgi:hypothetical protein
MRRLTPIFGFLLAFPCSAAERPDQVRVYYVPFGIETFLPITPENIETRAFRVGTVEPAGRAANELRSIIAAAKPGAFDAKRVRALIRLPDMVISIDSEGGIYTPSGPGVLSPAQFASVRSWLGAVTIETRPR